MSARLSPAEIAAYRADGQLTPRWRLPPARLAAMRRSLDALIALDPGARTDLMSLPHVPTGEPARDAVARQFFGYATDPDLLDLVAQLIGPDIALWASTVFGKPAGDGLEVPWHQDGQYWPIRPCATVTVWIALDDVTRENGCMRVLPGSHRAGALRHEVSERTDLVLNNVVADERLDPRRARDVVLEAGQVSLHDAALVHGSAPNRSARRRAGYAIRYMPTTSHYDRELELASPSNTVPVAFADRPIWLVRGVDRCGRNDYVTGHTLW